MKYFWVALGHDVPIDSKENGVAQDRKLTTKHNDAQADNSINDGTIFSILFLSKTTYNEIMFFLNYDAFMPFYFPNNCYSKTVKNH